MVMLLSIIMGRMREKTGDGSFEPHLEDMKKLSKKSKKKRKGKPGLVSTNSSAALLTAAARVRSSGAKSSKANLKAARTLKRSLM